MKISTPIKYFSIAAVMFAAIFLSSVKSFAACQANFTWVQSSANVINFTDASTGTTGNTFYQWDFGNGSYDYTQNPVHTFPVPGTYRVCLTITDSNFISCTSTFCDSVVVTGTLICTLSVNTSQSIASCPTCADATALANVYGGTPPFTYQWSNGTTANSASNLLPGTYSVCVTDSNGCSDCSSFTIYSSSCQANFTWTQGSPNVITFTDASTGTGSGTFYYWDFGNGNYDYIQNPIHTFSAPGTYNVCLTIQDSNSTSCNSTFCTVVTVTGTLFCNLSLSANQTTYASCPACADGAAYAYASGGTPPYSYSWSTGLTGNYATSMTPGSYMVCATDANGCTSCDSVIITTSFLTCMANFYLYPDSTLPHTYYAVNLSSGSQPITYRWDWGDGNTDSLAFPSHTYASAGYYTICLTISDSNGCSSTFCDSAYILKHNLPGFSNRNATANAVVTVNVISPVLSGINSTPTLKGIEIFPNPVASVLNVTLSGNKHAVYKLYSFEGAEILNGTFSAKENTLDIKNLHSGIYILQVKDATGLTVYSKVVKQ